MDLRSTIAGSPANAILASSSLILAAALGWMIRDYNAWINFGTGGTPPNLQGYLKITKFRVLRAFSGDRLNDVSMLPSNGTSYLPKSLPRRQGAPPGIISRTLPQRQYPAKLSSNIYERLHALPAKYAEKYPDLLTISPSVTEGRSTDAIYARPEKRQGAKDKILGNEIAHVHPAENSLHVWLTQADTRKVVEAGWGLRFPLASLGMVDEGWTFVYAPRSTDEVDIVDEIVRAGIGHLTGEEISA
jgi:hypothetical protein